MKVLHTQARTQKHRALLLVCDYCGKKGGEGPTGGDREGDFNFLGRESTKRGKGERKRERKKVKTYYSAQTQGRCKQDRRRPLPAFFLGTNSFSGAQKWELGRGGERQKTPAAVLFRLLRFVRQTSLGKYAESEGGRRKRVACCQGKGLSPLSFVAWCVVRRRFGHTSAGGDE